MTGPRARTFLRRLGTAVALMVLTSLPAAADICKYIDAEGRIIYSNVEIRDARKIDCTIVTEEPSRKPAPGGGSSKAKGSAPPGFPRVDSSTQKSRDDVRRQVLAEELTAEEKLLEEARSQYNDGAPVALPAERDDQKKYADRVQKLRQAVQLHERNVEALRKELTAVR